MSDIFCHPLSGVRRVRKSEFSLALSVISDRLQGKPIRHD